MLSMNVNLFVLDIEAVKNKNMDFYEELQKVCFHPKRVQRYLEEFNYDLHNDEIWL